MVLASGKDMMNLDIIARKGCLDEQNDKKQQQNKSPRSLMNTCLSPSWIRTSLEKTLETKNQEWMFRSVVKRPSPWDRDRFWKEPIDLILSRTVASCVYLQREPMDKVQCVLLIDLAVDP